MALESTDNRVKYSGNGSTTVFSFPYYFLEEADLVVIERVDSTGVETVKTLTTHYTVSGEGDEAGGSVTMLTAPASGRTLIIYRDPAIVQEVDLEENNSFPAATNERALDLLTMVAQRLSDRLDRTVGLTDGFDSDFDPTLPTLLEAGQTIIVNDDADGFEAGPTADEIEDAQANATAAAASATAAATSASAASTSATAAASSASAAAASAASVAPTVFGSTGTPRAVVAGTGLTSGASHMSTTAQRQVIFVEGSGGAVDVSANPQIEAHTVVGAELRIIGTDDTNSVQFDNSDGLRLNGPAVLLDGYILGLMWDGAAYLEIERNF
jgi:hypothetical protein